MGWKTYRVGLIPSGESFKNTELPLVDGRTISQRHVKHKKDPCAIANFEDGRGHMRRDVGSLQKLRLTTSKDTRPQSYTRSN